MLRGRPFGGVITLIRNELRCVTETVHCDERFVIVRVANCLIINVYMPCAGTCNRELICEEMLFNISEFCERFCDCHLVCAGDFNVNLDSSDVVLSLICKFAVNHSLLHCDDLFPQQKKATYVHNALNHESQIDFFLTSLTVFVNDFVVLDPDINFSDHLRLAITLSLHAVSIKPDPVKRRSTTRH